MIIICLHSIFVLFFSRYYHIPPNFFLLYYYTPYLLCKPNFLTISDITIITLFCCLSVCLSGWLPQHREAINQSDELRGVEDLTRSTVLYHNNKEKVISADVLSVNTTQQAEMMTYLSSLKPTQVDWTVPYQYISEYDIQRWNEIQKRFAIRVNAKWKEMPHRADPDWAMQQRTKKELRVWAFNNFAEKALQYISVSRYHSYPSTGSVDSNSDSDIPEPMDKMTIDFDTSVKGNVPSLIPGLGPGPSSNSAWGNASHIQANSRSQVQLQLATSS